MVFALLAGVPIVGIKFWTSVLEAIDSKSSLPDANLFTLSLQDKGIGTRRVSLQPNSKRKQLFQGKKFIFFSECTYNSYEKMIRCAGGVPELHVVDTRDILNLLIPNSNLIIQLTNADNTSINPKLLNSKLNEELQKKNHRMIAETEIPLAIMYASLDQYCNPTYHFKQLIMRKSLKEDTSEVLVLDTQDILVPNFDCNHSTCASKRIFVPETNGYTPENEESEQKMLTPDTYQSHNKVLIAKKFSSMNVNENVSTVQLKKHFYQPPSSSPIKKYVKDNSISEIKLKQEINQAVTKLTTNESETEPKFKNTEVTTEDKNELVLSEYQRNKLTMKRKISHIDDNGHLLNSYRTNKSLLHSNKILKTLNSFKGTSKNEFDRSEFKKPKKKSTNFDLDDLISNPANGVLKPKSSSKNSNRESPYSFEKIMLENHSQLLYSNKNQKVIPIQSDHNNDDCSRKNNQISTLTKSSEVTGIKNKYLEAVKINHQCLLRSSVEKHPNKNSSDSKSFVKVLIQVSTERISLSDMCR